MKGIEFLEYVTKTYTFFKIGSKYYCVINDAPYNLDSEEVIAYLQKDYITMSEGFAPPKSKLCENLRAYLSDIEMKSFDKQYNRILYRPGLVVYDLNKDGQVIEVDSKGYRKANKIEKSYLNLVVQQGQYQQLEPKSNQESLVDLVSRFTNFSNIDDLYMYLIWLIASFFPELKSPALILLGEQGSGKSVTSELTKSIVDPSSLGKQHKLNRTENFAIVVEKNYMTIIDNLSKITNEISDAFCQSVSHGQHSRRKLYSDSDLVTLEMKGKLILNGITVENLKPDLLERSVMLNLEKLDSEDTEYEEDIYETFNETLPKILHHVFSAIAYTLGRTGSVRLNRKFRMADFIRYAVSIGEYLGLSQDKVVELYSQNMMKISAEALNIPIANALIEFLKHNGEHFEGTMTTLLNELKKTRYSGLPKAPNKLSNQLTRISSNLSKIGYKVKRHKDSEGNRICTIEKN